MVFIKVVIHNHAVIWELNCPLNAWLLQKEPYMFLYIGECSYQLPIVDELLSNLLLLFILCCTKGIYNGVPNKKQQKLFYLSS